jgi:hypothetical protein
MGEGEMMIDWEDVWGVIGTATFVLAVVLLVVTIFAPKNVDYYYIGINQHTTCAYAHWTWETDDVAFCSNDQNQVIDFVAKANAALPKK